MVATDRSIQSDSITSVHMCCVVDEESTSDPALLKCGEAEYIADIEALYYLESINCLLIRTASGGLVMINSSLEDFSPLAVATIDSKAQIFYNEESGSLVFANERLMCIRRKYSGTFLLKTPLDAVGNRVLNLEVPLGEASTFVRLASIDDDGSVLSRRPHLTNFISTLTAAVVCATSTRRESVVVQVNGAELLAELKPLELHQDGFFNVPMEWLSRLWPLVSSLAERIRLLLNGKQPYNFNSILKGKGYYKELMVSEVARRYTFETWPHMNHRWALPAKMAEAGFYYEPNQTGDDRVLCFACSVCLVCWEPSDEPWYEHRRQSPNCRFISNDVNPNVSAALTMSALSPFVHSMTASDYEPIYFSQNKNCCWIACAFSHSSSVHLWRTDRVVQSDDIIIINAHDSMFMCQIGECGTNLKRRVQQVTWYDDKHEESSIGNKPTDDVRTTFQKGSTEYITTQERIRTGKKELDAEVAELSRKFLLAGDNLVRISSLCTVGRPRFACQSTCFEPERSEERCSQSVIVIGVLFDDSFVESYAKHKLEPSLAETASKNSCGVQKDKVNTAEKLPVYRPFISVYRVNESSHFHRRKKETDQMPPDILMEWMNKNEVESFQGCKNIATPKWIVADKDIRTLKESSKLSENVDKRFEVDCETPLSEIVFQQCFRLPLELDNSHYKVSSIQSTYNGFGLIVVVNRTGSSDETVTIQSSVLVYRLHFSPANIVVDNVPIKIYFDHRERVEQLVVINSEQISGHDSPLYPNVDAHADILDQAIIRNSNEEVWFVSLNDDRRIKVTEEKIKTFCYVGNGKCVAVNHESKLILLHLGEMYCWTNFDGSKNLSIPAVNCSQGLECTGSQSNDTPPLLTSQPLTLNILKRLWKLTRTDTVNLINHATSHISAVSGLSVSPPASWCELQINQKLRINTVCGIRDRMTRTWQFKGETEQSARRHIFEINFSVGTRISHLNVRLNTGKLAYQDVNLYVYKRTQAGVEHDLLSHCFLHCDSAIGKQPSSVNDDQFLKKCELVVGPLSFRRHMDLIYITSIIQLPGNLFFRSEGATRDLRYPPFFFVLEYRMEEMLSSHFAKPTVEHVSNSRYCRSDRRDNSRNDSNMEIDFFKNVRDNSEVTKLCTSPSSTGDQLSLTLFTPKRGVEINEEMLRNSMVQDQNFHRELLLVAIGKLGNRLYSGKVISNGERMLGEIRALDIFVWLVDNWIGAESWEFLSAFMKALSECVDSFLFNGFVRAPRTIAHKWCSLLTGLLSVYTKKDFPSDVYETFLLVFVTGLTNVIAKIYAVKSAGSLRWLLVTAFAVVKQATQHFTSFIEKIKSLLCECVNALKAIASAGKTNISRVVFHPFFEHYGCDQRNFNLGMYDWPSILISLRNRNLSYLWSSTSSAMPPFVPSSSRTAVPSSFSKIGRRINNCHNNKAADPLLHPRFTTFISRLNERRNICWQDFFNLSPLDNFQSSSPESIKVHGIIDAVKSPFLGAQSDFISERKILLSPQQLCGLLETEPLSFSVISASENVRIQNSETGSFTAVSSAQSPANQPGETNQSTFEKEINDLIREKAFEQSKTYGNVPSQVEQGSSEFNANYSNCAKTLCVPATSMAMPFMTPTLLTPAHLSSHSSGANLGSQREKNCVEVSMKNTDGTKISTKSQLSHLQSSIAAISPDLLKPAPLLYLYIEKLFGNKFVVIDFGAPVFLSDFLIPSVAEMAIFCLDVWLLGENIDGQRLIKSSEISRKCIVVQDIAPSAPIRYAKLTYICAMDYGQERDCQLPLGLFFGHRFFCSWQLSECSFTSKQLLSLRHVQNSKSCMPIGLTRLRQSCEDLRCRHRTTVEELKRLIRIGADKNDVDLMQGECCKVRIQWNIVRGVVMRLEYDSAANNDEEILLSSWVLCCEDQLRFAAEELFSMLRQCVYLLKLYHSNKLISEAIHATIPSENLNFLITRNMCSSLLDLDTTLLLFDAFCSRDIPRLQAECVSWLFVQGVAMDWWPEVFPQLLKKVLSSRSEEVVQKLFLLVSFLCALSVKSFVQLPVLVALLNSLETNARSICVDSCAHSDTSMHVWEADLTLFCWTLVLTSTAFDVALGNKRKVDRWTFLSGEQDLFTEKLVDLKAPYSGAFRNLRLIPRVAKVKSRYRRKKKKDSVVVDAAGESDLFHSTDGRRSTKIARMEAKRRQFKQYNSQLNLPLDLCLNVSRRLVQILGQYSHLLPVPGLLLVCKLVARICSSSAHQPIPLAYILEENFTKLLRLGMNADSSSVRQAVLYLVLDAVEAESESFAKLSFLSNTDNTDGTDSFHTIPAKFFSAWEFAKSCLGIGGVDDETIIALVKNRYSHCSDILGKKSNGTTARRSGVNTPFSSCKTSKGFSIANYDEPPKDMAQFEKLLLQAVNMVANLSDEYDSSVKSREMNFRKACLQAGRIRYTMKKEPFCCVFRWIDHAIIEESHCPTWLGAKDFNTCLERLVTIGRKAFGCGENDVTVISLSALIACLRNEAAFIQESLNVHENAAASVMKPKASDISFQFDAVGEICDLGSNTDAFLSASDEISEERVSATCGRMINQCSGKFNLSVLFGKTTLANYPFSTLYDERMESQLGLQQYLSSLIANSLADVISRESMHDITAGKTRPVYRRRPSEDEIFARMKMGRTLTVALDCMAFLLEELLLSCSIKHVERSLAFITDFMIGVAASTKRVSNSIAWKLPAQCLEAVLSFAVNYGALISEQLHSAIFHFLYVASADIRTASQLTESDDFFKLLRKALIGDTDIPSSSRLLGPALKASFGKLLRRLHETPLRSVLATNLLQSISRVFFKPESLWIWDYSIDMLVELLNIMKEYSSDYCSLPGEVLAQYISSTVQFTRKYYSLQMNSETVEAFQLADSKEMDSSFIHYEKYFSSLLAEAYRYADCKIVTRILIIEFPIVIYDLFIIITLARGSDADIDPEKLSLSNCELTSSLNCSLSLLLRIARMSKEDTERLVTSTISALEQIVRGYDGPRLPKAIALALIQMLLEPLFMTEFVKSGGHKFIANELQRYIINSFGEYNAPMFTTMSAQLSAMSLQITSDVEIMSAPRMCPDTNSDLLYNFAPICSVTCKDGVFPDFKPVLCSPLSSKHARGALWTYYFCENERWVDFTVNIPHRIILHEIQIRPHNATFHSAPSAVQIELCSDPGLSSWVGIGSPMCTLGLSRIRMCTLNHSRPVGSVKIYLRRAPSSSCITLSQILIIGSNLSMLKCGPRPRNTDIAMWLAIIGRVDRHHYDSIWSYAPKLPLIITSIFLKYSLSIEMYEQITTFFVHIDNEHGKPCSVVELLLENIADNHLITSRVSEWLADVLFKLCTINDHRQIHSGDHAEREAFARQHQLLSYIYPMLTSNRVLASREVVSVVLWSAACVVWNNACEIRMQQATRETCMNLAPQTLPQLCEIASGKKFKDDSLVSSASWLLASFMRSAPHLFNHVLDSIKAFEGCFVSVDSLLLISRVGLSLAVVKKLIDQGLIDSWIKTAIELCEADDVYHQPVLIAILKCISSLCFIRAVPDYLQNMLNSQFFNSLISFIVRRAAGPRISELETKWSYELEDATINLIRRCLSWNEKHRSHIAQIVSSILKTTSNSNGAVKQMILRCVLDDETIDVKVADDYGPARRYVMDIRDRIGHPVFGCTRRTYFANISVYMRTYDLMTVFFPDRFPTKEEIPSTRSIVEELGNYSLSDDTMEAYADGFLALSFAVVPATSSSEEDYASKSLIDYMEISSDEFPISTLLFFARAGGLSFLAQHIQFHHPSSYPNNTVGIQHALTQKAHALDQYMAFVEDGDIDVTCPSIVSTDSVTSLSEDMPPITFGDKRNISNSNPNGLAFNCFACGMPPHLIAMFSVFLRLQDYAELLVHLDRHGAKKLLRIAMGISSTDHDEECHRGDDIGRTTSVKNNTNARSASSDAHYLLLAPLLVLENLFKLRSSRTVNGRSVRECAVTHGPLDVLLVCLAHYSRQKVNSNAVRPPTLPPLSNSVALTERLLKAHIQADFPDGEEITMENAPFHILIGQQSSQRLSGEPNFWASGTGFGSGTTQRHWDVDLHVIKRRIDEKTVTLLFRILASFFDPRSSSGVDRKCDYLRGFTKSASVGEVIEDVCDSAIDLDEPWIVSEDVLELLSQSSVLPTLCSYLRNDSVLDISRNVGLYLAAVELLTVFTVAPVVFRGERRSILNALQKCERDLFLLPMLLKFEECITSYLDRLSNNYYRATAQDTSFENDHSALCGSNSCERKLTHLVELIRRIRDLIANGSENESMDAVRDTAQTMEEMYVKIMRPIQFETIPFLAKDPVIQYCYRSSLHNVSVCSAGNSRTRRLAQEFVTLSNSLPLSYSNSVFVRSAEERLDVMKVMITGPAGTPYMNGCFEFDIWFPYDYPHSPMQVTFETTGNGTVRFNPNLYADGKVCLSVLNTWHGRPEERWNPETSNLIQVIVSIQSLILVCDPYFNEPGFERSRMTTSGQEASREYSANTRHSTVKWTMLEMIRRPPVAFDNVVRRHFWLKRHEIKVQMESWIGEIEGMISGEQLKNGNTRPLRSHLSSLKKHADALMEELNRMQCPLDIDEKILEKLPSQDLLSKGTALPNSSDDTDISSRSLEILKI